MIEQKLERVKSYIANKEFDNARAILETLNHPKRGEWLDRVDSIQRQHAVDQVAKPMNPGILSFFTFILTPFVSILLLAFNWRRFEKKSWMWWTILVPILLVAAGVGIWAAMIFAELYRYINLTLLTRIAVGVVFFIFILIFDFPFLIATQQGKAYQLIKQKNIYAAYSYPYRWFGAIVVWLIISAVLALGLTWTATSQPETYSDGWISLTMPFGWDADDDDISCDDYGEDCHVLITPASWQLRVIFYDASWLEMFDTSEKMADVVWEWLEDNDYEQVSNEEIMIQGYEANMVAYTDPDGTWHYVDIYITHDDNFLLIIIEGENQTLVENNWNDVINILETMEWTP